MLSDAQLFIVEIFCEAVLYGVYWVLFGRVIYILISARSLPRAQKVMFAIAILMFMLATAHMACFVYEAMNDTTLPQVTQATVAIANIHTLVADSVLIWRVWVVWGRNRWITLIPITVIMIGSAFGFYLTAGITAKNVLSILTVPTAVLSIVNTLLCTLLIVGRMWYVQRRMRKIQGLAYQSSSPYRRTAMLFIGLGLIYTITVTTGIILGELHSPGLYVVLNTNIQWIGILPTVIIVRVHLDTTSGSQTSERSADSKRATNVTRRPSAATRKPSTTFGSQTVIPLHSTSTTDQPGYLERWDQRTEVQSSIVDVKANGGTSCLV